MSATIEKYRAPSLFICRGQSCKTVGKLMLVGTLSVSGLPRLEGGLAFVCTRFVLMVAELLETDCFIIIGFRKVFPVAWI